ncbi:hypothetical protein BO70DRAFT_397538 [Aspergillus heteromorphus CBS 117.55]|uniref:Uncharacterized protein n=1 Tax=Aspergillus heteromorphus CBS 117.55 TaxID=1448321 RepID=A0A317VV65_9EURO|nr:uncharacterized protein BO70DRAFT_397538 [Aspergillus heteromorphus CBS 117.55]PWY78294.1 hypothetical protein BO70DRAFT_397538 [Aspergillus heteromorphus CBS 117.55]
MDSPTETTESTAAQRALMIHEVVGLIVEHIWKSIAWSRVQSRDREIALALKKPEELDGSSDRVEWKTGTLLNCALVNKLWSSESMRHLWSVSEMSHVIWKNSLPLEGWKSCLIGRFRKIEPARRQYYADFIRSGSNLDFFLNPHGADLLEGIELTKVNHFFLLMPLFEPPGCYYLPFVKVPNLIVHPGLSHSWDAAACSKFLKDVLVHFPSLKTLQLVKCKHRYPDPQDILADTARNLKEFEGIEVFKVSYNHVFSRDICQYQNSEPLPFLHLGRSEEKEKEKKEEEEEEEEEK